MPGRLAELDRQLFLFLNHLGCDGLDPLMRFLSSPGPWILLAAAILILAARRNKWKIASPPFWILIAAFAAAYLISEQSSVHLFKNIFERLRPCHEPSLAAEVRLAADRCGGLYGFVSTHTSNSFALAMLAILVFKRCWLTISLLAWAGLISYSRIYLGVHYPGDVLGGMVLGVATSLVVYLVYRQMERERSRLSSG
ncbi:MAG: phosphatase PAP2 family protein [Bacteroidales bacterium]